MYHELPKPNAERARYSIMGLYAMVAFHSLDVITNLLLANVIETDYSMVGSITIGNGIIGFVQTIINIILYVVFIQWFRRAYNNLHLMGARNLEFGEGWAAGAWFVPILNYFRPYKIMVEIWRETQLMGRTPNDGYEEERPALVGWWWAAWLLAYFFALYATLHQLSNLQIGYMQQPVLPSQGDYFSLALSNAMYAVAGLLAIRMIRKVSAWEDDLMQRYNNYMTLRQQQQYTQQQEQSNPDTHPGPPPSNPL